MFKLSMNKARDLTTHYEMNRTSDNKKQYLTVYLTMRNVLFNLFKTQRLRYETGNKNLQSEYDKIISLRKEKRIKIMATNIKEKSIELVDDSFGKMSVNERVFFILYNSVDYYDNEFGGKTYLNEVLSYLVAYCKYDNNISDYGYFVSGMNMVNESEGIVKKNKKESSAEYGMTHFRFNNVQCYAEIKRKANKLLQNPNILNATKELVNYIIDDPDKARAECILGVKNIILQTDSDKVKLEAYKLLGNWLGIEKPTKEITNTVVFKGIDSALASEDFLEDVKD